MGGLLDIEVLESGYGSTQVLWGSSLSVALNQSVVLLGVNGAGKTTLLKTIVGLLGAWKGRIVFDGKDITSLKPNLRIAGGIGYMSELGILPNLTVEENLELGGYFRAEKDNRKRAEEMFEYFPDLREYRKKMGGSLSGGQRKMLGVAKTLMSSPKLVIMDEPSSGLSPKFVKKVIEVLRLLHEHEKLSMLIAEQNVSFLDFAEKIYILDKGQVTFGGDVEQLKGNDTIRETYFGISH
ncbi:MAG: ABC transporter ATP-binding protein [Deltaproteobacteria bacterium]|jgi:branched-chain amino acid transport system ATP-binding protein|nr:ABC transporter ATP-binding protein [Deltaproteobacteria bacterium]MDA8305658.1 ABC transporter ATP-binding protein [Deltaproteobacteria bacterium]